MFNIHYNKDTGRIISYQDNGFPTHYTQMPPNCDLLSIDNYQNLDGLRVDLNTKQLVQKTKTLIGEDRAEALAKEASECPPGCFIEIGVYRGGSAFHLLGVANKQKRILHLYDTFTGIPYADSIDLTPVGTFSDTNVDEVRALLPEAMFHIGVFPDTLTDDIQNIAFVHFDGDQYQCTKAMKELLWPRMVSGGKIFFDDSSFHGGMEGVNVAIEEDFPGMIKEHTEVKMKYVVKP